ncbi:MAG: S8 family serine peptidase [Bacteroidales bacterium]|nr:S8 family serine peptidase [Bacteroidales bacterium]
MKILCYLMLIFILNIKLLCQNNPFNVLHMSHKSAINTPPINWHFLDPKKDNYPGISLNRAYNLLKKTKRKPQKVIVAIIDSGVDTAHTDLIGVLWKNKKEIPYNLNDDDKNGYIDDIYGWNFLGNSNGENIKDEAYEYARIYGRWKDYFKNTTPETISSEEKALYNIYKKAKEKFELEYLALYQEKFYLTMLKEKLNYLHNLLKSSINKDSLTEEDVSYIKENIDSLKFDAYIYQSLLKEIDTIEINERINEINTKFKTELNYKENLRKIINDNPYDIRDSLYGNNNVKGPTSSHGTFVAGIIAGDRTNNNEAMGIADCVEIMCVRILGGGDERDKDVALGIKYAVKNGAKIINMSFGKYFSPEKHMVDEAIKYASKHNVLIIHAAGNDALNNDINQHYPIPFDENYKLLTDLWIEVGASSYYLKYPIAPFSNYGKNTVDIFAPGEEIFGLSPDNKFESNSGTSAAAPIVTGIAALLMGYFPELTPKEIKEIILKSAYKIKQKKPPYNYRPLTLMRTFSPALDLTLSEACQTGGIVNAYNAVKLAIKYAKKKKK